MAETTLAPAPADQALAHLLSGMWVSRLIQAVAELGIADALHQGGPARVADLAAATGADPDTLNRVLRALAALGVFAPVGDGTYVHTEMSRLLRRDEPGSMVGMVGLFGADWQWRSWSRLADSLRSGRAGFVEAHGKDIWAYFAEDEPAAGAAFQEGMNALAAVTDGPLADALDVTGVHTLVDVGGGHGNLLAAVLDRHPHLDAVLFESEATLHSLHADPKATERAARFTSVAGDALAALDVPADMYLLKQLIHLFDDDAAVRIIGNCAAKANNGARVVVIERLITDDPDSAFTKLVDLQMFMVQPSGRERTEQQFARLFERAGLRFQGVTPTTPPTGMYLIHGAV